LTTVRRETVAREFSVMPSGSLRRAHRLCPAGEPRVSRC
jgi:hypothetical protein